MPVTTRQKWYIGIVVAVAIVGGAMLQHPGRPQQPPERTVFVPYQPPLLERYQTLIAGIFAVIGGFGAIFASAIAYRGAVKGAELTAQAAIRAAQVTADEVARDRNERFDREDAEAESNAAAQRNISIVKTYINAIRWRQHLLDRKDTLETMNEINCTEFPPEIILNIIEEAKITLPNSILSDVEIHNLGEHFGRIAGSNVFIENREGHCTSIINLLKNQIIRMQKLQKIENYESEIFTSTLKQAQGANEFTIEMINDLIEYILKETEIVRER